MSPSRRGRPDTTRRTHSVTLWYARVPECVSSTCLIAAVFLLSPHVAAVEARKPRTSRRNPPRRRQCPMSRRRRRSSPIRFPSGATRVHSRRPDRSPSRPARTTSGSRGRSRSRQMDGYIVGIRPICVSTNGTVPPVDVHPPASRRVAQPAGARPDRHRACPNASSRPAKRRRACWCRRATATSTRRPTTGCSTTCCTTSSRSRASVGDVRPRLRARRRRRPPRASSPRSRCGWTCRTAASTPCSTSSRAAGTNGQYTYPDDANEPLQRRARRRTSGPRRTTARCSRPPATCTRAVCTTTCGSRARARTGSTGHTKPGAPDTAHLFSSVATYFEPAGPRVVGRLDVGARPPTGGSR